MSNPAKSHQLDAYFAVVRSARDGKLERVIPSKAERVARSKFLRIASLEAVPKKKKLTKAKASKIVAEYFSKHAQDSVST